MEPFRVGDLFEPDQIVDQWVFALSAAVSDLATAESLFQDALHDENSPPLRTSYLFRQVIARIYESDRVVLATVQFPEIAEFLSVLPYAPEPLGYLRGQFLPDGDSKVREVFGHVRNRTVHHSRVGSAELRQALADASDQQARILVDVERECLYYEWPEAVISHGLSPDLSTDEGIYEFAERARYAQEITAHLAQLLRAVLHAYVEQRGEDIDRLYHPVGES